MAPLPAPSRAGRRAAAGAPGGVGRTPPGRRSPARPSLPLLAGPHPVPGRRGPGAAGAVAERAGAAEAEAGPVGGPGEGGAEARTYDVVVVGAGPAGLGVAARVAGQGFRVCLVDPDPEAYWPNNYGVWVDEFEAMGLEDCFETVWDKASVHLDNGAPPRFLRRRYARVDRAKLKARFLGQCRDLGVDFVAAKGEGVAHAGGVSTVACSNGTAVGGRLVVDATGHARKLVEFDEAFDPGYQAAYGVMIDVPRHPFPVDTMVFMDWRDDHLDGSPAVRERNAAVPTFLYVMPFSPTKIFVEETSLVARPAVGFDDLKERLAIRLRHLGVEYDPAAVEEEEYCLIPMGGVLPAIPQRVLGVGGTAGMVHPSTGYMVARTLGAVPTVADAICDQLHGGEPRLGAVAGDPPAEGRKLPGGRAEEAAADAMAAEVWDRVWPVERIQQREFFNFGMDILLTFNLAQTREFFAAFFSLSDFHWQGFLSSRLSFPQLIVFGLSLFKNCSNSARLNLITLGLPGVVKLVVKLWKTF